MAFSSVFSTRNYYSASQTVFRSTGGTRNLPWGANPLCTTSGYATVPKTNLFYVTLVNPLSYIINVFASVFAANYINHSSRLVQSKFTVQ
jgi:hypothetical protein